MIAINGLDLTDLKIMIGPINSHIRRDNPFAQYQGILEGHLLLLIPTDVTAMSDIPYGQRFHYWVANGKIYDSYFTDEKNDLEGYYQMTIFDIMI